MTISQKIYFSFAVFIPILAFGTQSDKIVSPADNSQYDYWLSQLTIEEKIGQLLMIRLPWKAKEVGPNVRELMKDVPVSGIALFSDNMESAEQIQKLIKDLQALARLPLFIAIDEEGGRVSRVGKFYGKATPPAYEIGKKGDTAVASATARVIAQRLTKLGINMNFAPIADIWSNPDNTVIGNRAFGKKPDIVGEMVEATVRGFASEGVLSVTKHFPGHGDTKEDSHNQLAIYPHERGRFDQMEALPFIKASKAGTDGIMVGHIITPAFKESDSIPVTFSIFWLQDILRREIGFDGLIITDGLDMRALTDNYATAQIVLGTFLAGADILLMPGNPRMAYQILLDGYNSGLFDENRLNQSLRRILRAKGKWLVR
ncbi:MAG: glycoside hydrolase family 3 protein [Fibromonadales bacterium]|nr:glycoside hydrolase family 3 protein [Fibromonadales bacterium]